MEASITEAQAYSLNDDAVEEMLALAERLRASNGGQLDELAIQAVAEATGAPTEYVRLVVKVRAEKERRGLVSNMRAQYLSLDPKFVATSFPPFSAWRPHFFTPPMMPLPH